MRNFYLCIQLPCLYNPLIPAGIEGQKEFSFDFHYEPYLGVKMIKFVKLYFDDDLIQEITGEHLKLMYERDHSENSYHKFLEGIGHKKSNYAPEQTTSELQDTNFYPSYLQPNEKMMIFKLVQEVYLKMS